MRDDLPQLERDLLTTLQDRFPLEQRPFARLADQVGMSEEDALGRVMALRQDGIIRQIGGIFDTQRLGYTSLLVAARVAPDHLDAVARAISGHPGVSHNYGRDHLYNLWFTLAVPPGMDVAQEALALTDLAGVEDRLLLPSLRVYKLRVRFDLANEPTQGVHTTPTGVGQTHGNDNLRFGPRDIPLVRALQEDLPMETQPYAVLAQNAGLDEAALLAGARRLLAEGFLRRYAAILRHRRAGYRANAMACWQLDPDDVARAGESAALDPAVSHCYERVSYPPRWPYQLYTMVHARSEQELIATLARLQEVVRPLEMAVLRTGREYKKVRLRYFQEPSELSTRKE